MTEIRITVENTSSDGGTFLTPFWFGTHDGTFDLYDRNVEASAGLEQLAEDGAIGGLNAELIGADADALGGAVFGAGGVIAPGETASTIISVDGTSNGYIDVASMIIPSNDAFVGTGQSVQLFDADGNFLGEQTISFAGSDVLDAGTEVNTEEDAAFLNQTGPNTGIDENGTVQLHEGFIGSLANPGEGGNILGGTNAAGAFIDPEAADFTQPGAQIANIHINTVNRVELDGPAAFQGTESDDLVTGTDRNDKIFGAEGWDEVFAGAGNDIVRGGAGNDALHGGAGNDRLFGDYGNDLLYGGTGDDFIFVGEGSDAVAWSDGDGSDVVRGFGADDTLILNTDSFETAEEALASATSARGGTVIAFDDGQLWLQGTDLAELSVDSFILA